MNFQMLSSTFIAKYFVDTFGICTEKCAFFHMFAALLDVDIHDFEKY